MLAHIEEYWLIIAIILGACALLLLFTRRRVKVVTSYSDVLDEGHGPAPRNGALIKAQPVATADEVPQISAHPDGDDLTKIKGLGPKVAAILNGLGITKYAQIASWDDADIARIDSQLGRFQGRIRRDNWVEQAKILSEGKAEEFAQKFGSH